jgi:eight-cysteine-cluster-containing protein
MLNINGKLFTIIVFLIALAFLASFAIDRGDGDIAEKDGCMITGCSGQVCAEEEVITTCEYRPEYECYKDAACERQEGGECGWTQTQKLKICLDGA